MKYLIIMGAVLGFSSIVSAESDVKKAESAQTLTLKEAQDMALQKHPEILSSQYEVKAAAEKIKEVNAGYLPQITGNSIATFAPSNTRLTATGNINNPSVYHRGSVGVNAKQLIFDFGRTGYLVDAEQNQMNAQKENQIFTEKRVIFAVTQSYYNILRALKILEVARKTLQSRQVLLERVKALQEAKIKSDLDVGLASQSVDEGSLLVIRAEADLNAARAKFTQDLGFNEQKDFTLIDNMKVISPPADINSLLIAAKDKNPQIRMLQSELDAARQKHEAEKIAHYPTINLVGYAGRNPIRDPKNLQPGYAAAGIELSVPIFTGGKITAGEQKAFYHAQAVEQTLSKKINEFTSSVKVAWNELQASYKNIDIASELRKNNEKTLELIEAGYNAGRNSIVDLRQAQLSKIQADINYCNAAYEYMINYFALEFILGVKIERSPAPNKIS